MSTAPHLTINLKTLVANWQKLDELSGKAEASAVVKADAYGLGLEEVGQALSNAGCKTFFVAMAEEGECLRAIAPQADIYVLNGIVSETITTILNHNLTPVLSSLEQINMWQTSGDKPFALHVDTGMNRLGLRPEEAIAFTESNSISNVKLLMSHLACADDMAHPKNSEQLKCFQEVGKHFPDMPKSFANSAGITHGPDYHFDITRPGISIYGGEAVNDVPNPMQVVVTAEARILQIRHTKKSETVGYGATQTLERDTKIAICSAGYADGFHRASSGSGVKLRDTNSQGGFGAINGKLVPLLGRVSMDLTAFDVTDLSDAELEDAQWVELFGHTIAVDDAARACGTIGYELLTSLGGRYKREWVG